MLSNHVTHLMVKPLSRLPYASMDGRPDLKLPLVLALLPRVLEVDGTCSEGVPNVSSMVTWWLRASVRLHM